MPFKHVGAIWSFLQKYRLKEKKKGVYFLQFKYRNYQKVSVSFKKVQQLVLAQYLRDILCL